MTLRGEWTGLCQKSSRYWLWYMYTRDNPNPGMRRCSTQPSSPFPPFDRRTSCIASGNTHPSIPHVLTTTPFLTSRPIQIATISLTLLPPHLHTSQQTMNSLPPLHLPPEIIQTYIQTSDLKYHVLQAGDSSKPLLLLLHGFPELAFSWRKVMGSLSRLGGGYWVVAFDQRGYGEFFFRFLDGFWLEG